MSFKQFALRRKDNCESCLISQTDPCNFFKLQAIGATLACAALHGAGLPWRDATSLSVAGEDVVFL
ncbi:hypothetical protein [Bradyrhizobium embrapense]